MKKLLPWLAGIFVLFAIYLYASPYIALHGIKTAVEQKDADKLSGYIDFPSVKQSIKDQIKARMVKEVTTSADDSGFEALGAMLATAIIDPIIDSAVTPDGVALMFQGQSPDFGLADDRTQDEPKAKNINYQTSYLSFNRFKVQINNTSNDQAISVILHRDWLSWKITRIVFPFDTDPQPDINLEDAVATSLTTAEASNDIDTNDIETDDIEFYDIDALDTAQQELDAAVQSYAMDMAATPEFSDTIETTGTLTPAQAAYIDYLTHNEIEVPQDMIDSLNDFTLGGGTEADMRQFIIERSGYEDDYRALEDCRNPDLTEAQFVSTCT